MHELSIALSIVDAVVEEADRHEGARVTQVHLKLGQLSGVVKEALLASYQMAAENTAVAGSELVIKEIPVMAFCPKCGENRAVVSPQQMQCGQCGGTVGEIVAGREMEIVAMEIIE